jgi:hypothetical protein
MATAAELLRQGRTNEVWRKYCGFLDLTLGEFMEIQECLLMEQIDLLSKSKLGRKLLREKVPTSVGQFRKVVPLTTYEDYPYLVGERIDIVPPEDMLPVKPYLWARTSGRSMEQAFKWAPYSREMVKKIGEFAVASFLLASCSGRGDVRLDAGDVCLYTLAPPPYFTASVAKGLLEQLEPAFIPPLAEGDKMEFGERIQEGFKLGLKTGIDLFYGLSSVLVAIAEQFQQRSGSFKFSVEMLHPRLLYRVIKGLVQSKVSHRGLLPKDLWKVKGIVAGGMDTAFYRDAIEAYWGRKPLEGYGGTEMGGVALQAWNYKGLTFLPDCNFLEFIPEEDFFKSMSDLNYRPSALRLDEVGLGVYELVITNFHGGVFVRYRTGDLVEIISFGDEELGIDIPQMIFHARADGVIDVGGFTRLTEKAVWQAIEESGVPYVDWTIRKEYVKGKSMLHLYLESKEEVEDKDIKVSVHQRLKEKDAGYAALEDMLDFDPLRVTVLSPGAFAGYTEEMQAGGADLAHIKPPRINPTDAIVNRLLST